MAVTKASNLSSVQLNSPRQKLLYDMPYFGDLDTTTDPTLLVDENSPDNLNVVHDSIRAIQSRKGYIKLLSTLLPSFVGGMYSLYQSTGTKQLVYGSAANLYWYNNAGASNLIVGTPATFTANQQWDFDEYQDSVYGGNGVDGLIAYNGTSYTLANSGITPQFVKNVKNRMYCANRNSSTLYFSDAGNPKSFPVNNFIQINTNDGQNITGISNILDNVVIFKDDSVWVLTGEPLGVGNDTTIGNLQLRQANSSVGCSAFRTICLVEGVLVFMHHTGIYMLQNYTVTLISPLLQDTFLNGMNESFVNLSWAVYSNQEKKYILGYPSSASATPDSAIVYDYLTKSYTKFDHLPGSCAVNFKFSGTNETIVMGDPNKGNIYELFQGNADIAGDTGIATATSSTSLTDNTKGWTAHMFIDARVKIVSGTAAGSVGVVTENTNDSLTVASWSAGTPDTTSVYDIGYFDSWWKTRNLDMQMVAYTKKFRFFNLFLDTELYPIQFGYSVDFNQLGFQKSLNLTSNAVVWGQAGITWGQAGVLWGSQASEYAQANIGSTGHYIQFIFGNNRSNQPWRAIHASISYKLKKVRANIVTT
jgi:hypothetical protein